MTYQINKIVNATAKLETLNLAKEISDNARIVYGDVTEITEIQAAILISETIGDFDRSTAVAKEAQK